MTKKNRKGKKKKVISKVPVQRLIGFLKDRISHFSHRELSVI